ncbi:MAG: hypothetical protein HQL95_13165, partial [Magnetococcales bacterium]|nr:hypothetical protein [Magnetococcales bacterium]
EDRKSILFAMGAIDINARYLNIDGLVQSGVDNIELNISKDFAPTGTVNFTDDAGDIRPGISFGADGLITVDGAFDAKNKVIVLDPIKPTGGSINLTGTIVSTGNGALRVASGYASVHIHNESAFELAVDTIDVSENRTGTITITDSQTMLREVFTVQNGKFDRVMKQGTLVAKTEGGTAVSSINYVEVPGSRQTGINAVMNSAGYTPIFYQPAPGRYYTWIEGQALTQTEVFTYEQKSFNLLGFDWDGLVPDEAAKDVDKKFADGTPLLESEEVTLENTNAMLQVVYLRKGNPAVDMVANKSLVRDVKTNKLYEYVGTESTVSFPVTDFTSTDKWKFLENLSGGRLADGVWENTESNPVLRADGSTWVAKKADYRLDSSFANQEITIKGPTTTGGGWLREKVVTTIKTAVTGLKDFYGYSLKADRPVNISSATGSDKPVIDIQTTGTLRLRSSISLGDSPIDEEAEDFHPIALSANALEVSGTALFSGALPEIKANSDVIIKVKDPRGKLNIQATGQIRVEQLAGKTNNPIKIGQVVAAEYTRDGVLLGAGADTTGAELSAAYDVQIVALNGILGTNALSRIVGSTVQLDGGAGLVMARVDSAPLGTGGVAVRADGSINIEETAGDLRLITPTAWQNDVSVITTGDVTLQARAGSIMDASLERYMPDGNVAAANMAKGGFENAGSGHYALAPDLIAFLLPHLETNGQGTIPAAEKLNIQGANIELISHSSTDHAAGVGRSSDRVTILNPGNFDALSTAEKALLSQASARDVVSATWQRYRYLGDNATLDLGSPAAFYDTTLWEEVSPYIFAPANLPVLSSMDGVADVRHGQWVEDKHRLLSVTIQLTDDINLSATGNLMIDSQGVVAVRAESEILIADGSGSALNTRGIQAAGNVWLSSAGSIHTSSQIWVGTEQKSWTPIKSGGDITLITDGDAGVGLGHGGIYTTIETTLNNGEISTGMDVMRIDLGAKGLKLPGNDGYMPGVLTVDASGRILIEEGTDLTGQTSNLWLATVQTRGIGEDGVVALSTRTGSIYASERIEHHESVNVMGGKVMLTAGDGASLGNYRNLGTADHSLRVDAETLSLKTMTMLRSVIAIEDVNDLTLVDGGVSVVSGSDGAIIQIRAQGDLIVGSDIQVSSDKASSIALQSRDGDLSILENIQFGLGALALQAGGNVLQGAGSLVVNSGGRITVIAGNGSLLQEEGAQIKSIGATLTVDAQKDVAVALLDAGAGVLDVWAHSGDIRQSGTDTNADLVAGRLKLRAAGSIGTLGRRGQVLEVAANTLNASAGDDLNLLADHALSVDGLTVGVAPVAPSTVSTSTGSAVLRTRTGSLTLLGAVSVRGSGNLLLQAQGTDSNLIVGTDSVGVAIAGSGGNMSLLASDSILLKGTSSLVSNGGALDLQALNGSLDMAAGSTASSNGGAVRMAAGSALSLARVDAKSGDISLLAGTGRISNALAGTTVVNLIGQSLRMVAGASIGGDGTGLVSETSSLRTTVARISAHTSNGSIGLTNTTNLEIGPVADFRIDRVVETGLVAPLWDVEQSGLHAGGTTSTIVVSAAGTMTVISDPALDDGTPVWAGSGTIALTQAGGAPVLLPEVV